MYLKELIIADKTLLTECFVSVLVILCKRFREDYKRNSPCFPDLFPLPHQINYRNLRPQPQHQHQPRNLEENEDFMKFSHL